MKAPSNHTEVVVRQEKIEITTKPSEKVESPSNRSSTITYVVRLVFIRNYVKLFDRNGTSTKGDANPFEEEEWDDNDALVDNGEPGVPVKALYDYEGAENDELSFKTGTKI